MSQWTHISGTIRIDALFDRHKIDINKIVGPTCNYHSPEDVWEKVESSDTPLGSAGSLQYKFFPYKENEDEEDGIDLPYGSIIIWGDLRDFYPEEFDNIEKWFCRVIKDLNGNGTIVRDAILRVEAEGYDPIIFTTIMDEEYNPKIKKIEGN